MDEHKFRKTIAELRVAIAAVDVVLFSTINNELCVFLVPIHRPPHYENLQGFPGGIIGDTENADQAALRHLKEKTNIVGVHIEQLYTFSDPDRDKRSRSISISYMALISSDQISTTQKGGWFSVKKISKLAYDHLKVLEKAVGRLQSKITYTDIAKNLLPIEFTLSELQKLYEIILGKPIDKRNFRKKILATQIVIPIKGKKKKTLHKPAQLYKFA